MPRQAEQQDRIGIAVEYGIEPTAEFTLVKLQPGNLTVTAVDNGGALREDAPRNYSTTSHENQTTAPALNFLDIAARSETDRHTNHTKIVKPQPAKESGKQRWQFWHIMCSVKPAQVDSLSFGRTLVAIPLQ